MAFILKLNFLVILPIITVQSESYFDKVSDVVTSNIIGPFLDKYVPPGIFIENEPDDNQYNNLHSYKFSTPLLLRKCIKFHDSEIVALDLHRASGQWDRHMDSAVLPSSFNYSTAEYDEKNQCLNFKYEPWGYNSVKCLQNYTKMLRVYFVVNDFLGIRITNEESMIGIDYDKYFVKFSCMEMAGKVTGTVHFHLRPEATAQLEANPELFAQILDSIPEKSLNKISHFIPKLIHKNDERFMSFGQKYTEKLTERLKKYRKDNELSDKSDDQMFQYLNNNCLKFSEEELNSIDLSMIASSKWTLVFSDNNNEKIPFNRITIQRLSENSFNVSLLEGNTFLADSDHYYDPNSRGFWTFTEGMRSFEVILHLDDEHRLTYCCEERQIGQKLQIKEKLRYFMSDKYVRTETIERKIFENILSQTLNKLKGVNVNKINQLSEKIHLVQLSRENIHQEL